jgi:hypothetical protein
MAERNAVAPTPDFVEMGADAERIAALYPVNRAPAPLPWHAAVVQIPDGIGKLTEGLAGYGS